MPARQWVWALARALSSRRLLYVLAVLVFLSLVWPRLWPRRFLDSRGASGESTCEHFLGRKYVADDRGRLCLWDGGWNGVTGCCNSSAGRVVEDEEDEEGEEDDHGDVCSLCEGSPLLCCPTYERCLACCQRHGTLFKWCLSNCRFSSRNVAGIKFKQPQRKFCIRI